MDEAGTGPGAVSRGARGHSSCSLVPDTGERDRQPAEPQAASRRPGAERPRGGDRSPTKGPTDPPEPHPPGVLLANSAPNSTIDQESGPARYGPRPWTGVVAIGNGVRQDPPRPAGRHPPGPAAADPPGRRVLRPGLAAHLTGAVRRPATPARRRTPLDPRGHHASTPADPPRRRRHPRRPRPTRRNLPGPRSPNAGASAIGGAKAGRRTWKPAQGRTTSRSTTRTTSTARSTRAPPRHRPSAGCERRPRATLTAVGSKRRLTDDQGW
jgi:hypothetical protein